MFSPVMAKLSTPSEFSLVGTRFPNIRFQLRCWHLDKNVSAKQKSQSQPCQSQYKKNHPFTLNSISCS